jgi:hypothetical protein
MDIESKNALGRRKQCCGSGSGIRCLFDPWIRDPGWIESQDPDPGWEKVGSGINIPDPQHWKEVIKLGII